MISEICRTASTIHIKEKKQINDDVSAVLMRKETGLPSSVKITIAMNKKFILSWQHALRCFI